MICTLCGSTAHSAGNCPWTNSVTHLEIEFVGKVYSFHPFLTQYVHVFDETIPELEYITGGEFVVPKESNT